MKKKVACPEVVKRILALAGSPEKVETTKLVYFDLMSSGLTKFDICDAICDWINGGKPMQEIVTEHAEGHIGRPAYVMKPTLAGVGYYIKVTVQEGNTLNEQLLIISAHPDH